MSGAYRAPARKPALAARVGAAMKRADAAQVRAETLASEVPELQRTGASAVIISDTAEATGAAFALRPVFNEWP